jgi:hypothetical protein
MIFWRPSVETDKYGIAKETPSPLEVAYQPCSGPWVRVVALVPIDTDSGKLDGCGGREEDTYKDLRPAIRGWVAQEPPRMTLCFPSKKSAAIISKYCVKCGATYPYKLGKASLARSHHALQVLCWSIPRHHPYRLDQQACCRLQ